jgi:hypothetical protein
MTALINCGINVGDQWKIFDTRSLNGFWGSEILHSH